MSIVSTINGFESSVKTWLEGVPKELQSAGTSARMLWGIALGIAQVAETAATLAGNAELSALISSGMVVAGNIIAEIEADTATSAQLVELTDTSTHLLIVAAPYIKAVPSIP